MYCWNCGKEVRDGASFCPFCGTDLRQDMETGAGGDNASAIGNNEENEKTHDSNQDTSPRKQGKKGTGRKTSLGIIIVIAITAAFILGITVYGNAPSLRSGRELRLGNSFLEELNYEEAVASFKKALEIDDSNTEAVTALADAYVTWGQSYIDDGQYDEAVDVLHEGIEFLQGQEDNSDKEIKDVVSEAISNLQNVLDNAEQKKNAVQNENVPEKSDTGDTNDLPDSKVKDWVSDVLEQEQKEYGTVDNPDMVSPYWYGQILFTGDFDGEDGVFAHYKSDLDQDGEDELIVLYRTGRMVDYQAQLYEGGPVSTRNVHAWMFYIAIYDFEDGEATCIVREPLFSFNQNDVSDESYPNYIYPEYFDTEIFLKDMDYGKEIVIGSYYTVIGANYGHGSSPYQITGYQYVDGRLKETGSFNLSPYYLEDDTSNVTAVGFDPDDFNSDTIYSDDQNEGMFGFLEERPELTPVCNIYETTDILNAPESRWDLNLPDNHSDGDVEAYSTVLHTKTFSYAVSESESSAEGETGTNSASREDNATEKETVSVEEQEIIPTALSASSQLQGDAYVVEHINDNDETTAWVEGVDGNGEGESVTFTIPGDTYISGIKILTGYHKSEDLFWKNAAPSAITLLTSTDSVDIDLSDYASTYTYQESYIALDHPILCDGTVRIVIEGVRAGNKYTDTCISELHLYGYSSHEISLGKDNIHIMRSFDSSDFWEMAQTIARSIHPDYQNGESFTITKDDLNPEARSDVLYWYQYFHNDNNGRDMRIHYSNDPSLDLGNSFSVNDILAIDKELFQNASVEDVDLLTGEDYAGLVRRNVDQIAAQSSGDFGDFYYYLEKDSSTSYYAAYFVPTASGIEDDEAFVSGNLEAEIFNSDQHPVFGHFQAFFTSDGGRALNGYRFNRLTVD